MAKILQNLSLRTLGDSLKGVGKRFPISLCFTTILTVWVLYLVWKETPGTYDAKRNFQEGIVNYYLGAGTLLSLVLELWCEEIKTRLTRLLIKGGLHALWLANALILLLCYDDYNHCIVAGMFVVVGGLIIFAIVLPFFREKDDMASWNFGLRTVWWGCIVSIICSILVGGSILLTESIGTLFNVNINNNINQTLATIFLIGLALLIWMMKIPGGEKKFVREPFSSGFIMKSVRYMLVPLMMCYLAVLYVYELKSIVTWTLPDGWVSTLVCVLMGFYIIMALFYYAARKEDLTRFDKWVNRYMPVMILPLVAMMTIGLGRRFSDYGITANRLYMLTLNIWFYYVLIRMFFVPSKRISWIGTSLAVVMAVVTLLPVNFYTLEERFKQSSVNGQQESEAQTTYYNWNTKSSEFEIPEGYSHVYNLTYESEWEIGKEYLTNKDKDIRIDREQFDRILSMIDKEIAEQPKKLTLHCTDGSILFVTNIYHRSNNNYASITGLLVY